MMGYIYWPIYYWPDATTATATTPIRQQIVSALETRLQAILTASGYRTNLGSSVHTWKQDKFQTSELPGCDIRDLAEDTAYVAVGEHWHKLNIDVRVVSTTEAAVRNAIADIVTAIGTDVTLGGLAEDITIETDGTIGQDSGGDSNVLGSLVRLTVEYATVPFTP